MREAKRIGFISDLHCGSRHGLLSPESDLGKQTPLQKYLWAAWLQSLDWLGNLDLLVLLGDLVDGDQFRSNGTGLITTNVGEQTQLAIDCFKAMKHQPGKILRVSGTPYHETFNDPLITFDAEYGATNAGVAINIEVAQGILLNVAHHPESMSEYDGTGMEKEARNASLAEHHYGLPKTRFLVRGHKHIFRRGEFHRKWVTICPCFQGQGSYARSKGQFKWVPEFGVVVMQRDESIPEGYRIDAKTFDMPTLETETTTYEKLKPSKFQDGYTQRSGQGVPEARNNSGRSKSKGGKNSAKPNKSVGTKAKRKGAKT